MSDQPYNTSPNMQHSPMDESSVHPPQPTPPSAKEADDKFRVKIDILLWEMACAVDRGAQVSAWSISHRYTKHLFALAQEWAGRLRESEAKGAGETDKMNAECALAAMEHTIKQRDETIRQRDKLSAQYVAALIERDDLRQRNVEALSRAEKAERQLKERVEAEQRLKELHETSVHRRSEYAQRLGSLKGRIRDLLAQAEAPL